MPRHLALASFGTNPLGGFEAFELQVTPAFLVFSYPPLSSFSHPCHAPWWVGQRFARKALPRSREAVSLAVAASLRFSRITLPKHEGRLGRLSRVHGAETHWWSLPIPSSSLCPQAQTVQVVG